MEEKIKLFEKLSENIQNLECIENEIAMLQLAINQKNVENLKEDKMNEIKEFFNQQMRIYKQNNEKYREDIEDKINKYEEQIDRLIKAYDNLYINIFKIMESAINNQKIAIANIVTLREKLNKEEINDKELQNIKNIIVACAQKKLNYAVIIDECKARIEWCIKNVQIDINEIFINNINQLQIRKIIFNISKNTTGYKTYNQS